MSIPTHPAQLSTLQVGDIVFVDVKIDKADSDPNATSGTAQKIRRNQHVTRYAVVLVAGATSIQVAYYATFNKHTKLPPFITDKSNWYPIQPAPQEDKYAPLPPLSNNKPQWICLRKKQTVTQNTVPKTNETISNADALLVLAAMKA